MRSAVGESHRRAGTGCQDYAHGVTVSVGESTILVLACADGAGSSSRSEEGAKLSCLSFVHATATAIKYAETGTRVDSTAIRSIYDLSRRRLSLEACRSGVDLREFACTLLTAVVANDWAIFSQIGDGAIVYRNEGGFKTAFWPQSGEYANTTNFLTGSDFDRHLETMEVDGCIDEIAVFSDGLQSLALQYSTKSVHQAFLVPMFNSLRSVAEPDVLELPLGAFLDSKAVNDRTDDDKTLILATRQRHLPQ